jgi:hypothetical protein
MRVYKKLKQTSPVLPAIWLAANRNHSAARILAALSSAEFPCRTVHLSQARPATSVYLTWCAHRITERTASLEAALLAGSGTVDLR